MRGAMISNGQRNQPPGRIKIVRAVRELLEIKDFNAITTAEIARTAGVTEGLIYKYFDNKRDLLYQVLKTYFDRFITHCDEAVEKADSALSRLRAIAFSYLDSYQRHRVFARILLLEVRNTASFFDSAAYDAVRRHSRIILGIIEKGIEDGEIRRDVAPAAIREAMFGAIEHATLAGIIFGREIDPEAVCDNICRILFDGIRR
jgi:TetR/AcrR family transcriptional regulator, fatty acid metabolism regulator protein